jgi:hypothetical protein
LGSHILIIANESSFNTNILLELTSRFLEKARQDRILGQLTIAELTNPICRATARQLKPPSVTRSQFAIHRPACRKFSLSACHSSKIKKIAIIKV